MSETPKKPTKWEVCRQCGGPESAEVHQGLTHFQRMVEVRGRGLMPTLCYHHFFAPSGVYRYSEI